MNNELRPGATVWSHLLSERGLKLTLLVTLNLWVYAPYLFLQRHHFFPVTIMSPSAADRMIPFSDPAVWLYLSIYLLMPIGPFLMNCRRQLFRYAAGIVLISLVADIVFLFWPTSCPRPAVSETNAAYGALIAIDNSFHAFPSIHAAFAVYSALCGRMVLREMGCRRIWQAGLWLWAFLILYATLATKQHVFVDIIAGSALGLNVYAGMFKQWISIFKSRSPVQPVAIKLDQPHPQTHEN